MISLRNNVWAFCSIVLLTAGCKKDKDKPVELKKAFSFLVKKADNSTRLYYMATDQTSFGEVIADNLGNNMNNTAWSPDGRTIYYIKESDKNGENGIYSTKPNGSDQGPVYKDNDTQLRKYYQLTSSNDNEHIVFSLQIPRSGRQVIELYRMCPCGDRVERLTQFETSQPTPISTESYAGSFSPDNKTLVYCQSDPLKTGIKDVKIYSMDIASRKDTLIKTVKAANVMGCTPSYSPDGKKLLLSVDGVIYLMNANGSEMKTVGAVKGFRPTWDTNGTDFYFTTLGINNANPGIYRSNIYYTEVDMISKSPSLGQYGGFSVNR